MVHMVATLPNVSGIMMSSPAQLARKCGSDVTAAHVRAAIAELTAGDRPRALWWPDDEVIWIVEAFDEQGSKAPQLRKNAAQTAMSFGPEVFTAFVGRYPWAREALRWTRGRPAVTDTGPDPEVEVEQTVSDTVSDRVSPTPKNPPDPASYPQFVVEKDNDRRIASAIRSIVGVEVPRDQRPHKSARERFIEDRVTIDEIEIICAAWLEDEGRKAYPRGALFDAKRVDRTKARYLPRPEPARSGTPTERGTTPREIDPSIAAMGEKFVARLGGRSQETDET